jgi:hypothetical protein
MSTRLPLHLAVHTGRTLPTESELSGLKKGDLVKVSVGQDGHGNEAFWIEIESVTDDRLSGRVDNDLVYGDYHGYACDQNVVFFTRHVLQIYYD